MSGRNLWISGTTIFALILLFLFAVMESADAQGDSPWIYGIHWYGDHLPSAPDNGLVEAMTGGKEIWALEIVLTEDKEGEWGLRHQLAKFKEIVARGHTIIIRIQPRWGVVVPGPGEMETFLDDVRETARELADIVHIWQIGNEMNLPWEYQTQTGEELTPALYVQKYKQIRDAIRWVPSSLGSQIVLLGPVAPLAEEYLKGMLRELGPDDVDGFAMHAYGGGFGNFMFDVALQAKWIDEFEEKGFERKPIYITEWGAKVNGLSDTNEKEISRFLLESFMALRDYNDPVANPGSHPIVCAIWFIYDRDDYWREWSILSLHDVNAPGVGLDLYDTFQEACRLDIPAGDDFQDLDSEDLLIRRAPSRLEPETIEGQNPANDNFTLFKTGPGSLSYELTTNAHWLSLTPATGNTDGEVDTITVAYETAGLPVGEYAAEITISDPNAANHPQSISVHLTVRAFAPDPVIVNPDFEDDYPRAFSVATGWSSFGGNKWEQVFDPVHRWTQGTSDVAPGGEGGGVYQNISVVPGASYRLSVYGLSQTPAYEVSIGADPDGTADAGAAAFSTPLSPAAWTEITHEFTATRATASLILRVKNKGGRWIFGKWALFDGVRIETVGKSTNLAPAVFITGPADGAAFPYPTDISVSADASDTDGFITKVEFFDGTEKLGEDTSLPYSWIWSGVSTGAHTLTAGATDDQGAFALSESIRITVGAPPNANLIVNGDFSQGLEHWSRWTERGVVDPAVNGNGQLHLSSVGYNGGVYQTFDTGGAGTMISIDGFWASSPTASLQWAEVLIINGGGVPTDGVDIKGDGNHTLLMYKNDTAAGWAGPMSETTIVSAGGSFVAAGDTATIVLKSGNLPGVSSGALFDDIIVTRSQ